MISFKTLFQKIFLPAIIAIGSANLIWAAQDIEADALRVIQEKGEVQVIGLEQDTNVTPYGVSLEDGDEVVTDHEGKARILLSMLSDIDEVVVGPLSRVRIFTKVSDSLTSIYHLHVLYGKIRVKTMLNRAKQIRFDTDLIEVTADEGEFIIESRKFGASVGTISGLTKVVHLRTGNEYQVPPKSMIMISPIKSVSPSKIFVNSLFTGVERNTEEIAEETY